MNAIFANHTIEERDGFKARQVSAARTPAQVVFDVVFGILMPVFCFYFDPGIVRAGLPPFMPSAGSQSSFFWSGWFSEIEWVP